MNLSGTLNQAITVDSFKISPDDDNDFKTLQVISSFTKNATTT